MSNVNLGVTASGASTQATGNAHRALRASVTQRLATMGASLKAFGARTLAAVVEIRTAQAMDEIERYHPQLAAQLRAERQGATAKD
jgi:hypothetical protein